LEKVDTADSGKTVKQVNLCPIVQEQPKPRPDFLQPQMCVYTGKAEGASYTFVSKVHFGNFDRMSAMYNKKQGYYPMAIYAACRYPEEPNKFYDCIYYFDLDTSRATSRLLTRKVHTSVAAGLFTLDEAYGLNSNRTDGDDSKECVICLTEPKNTLAKPCKHVSMCHSCA
jgi:hypothetical protein